MVWRLDKEAYAVEAEATVGFFGPLDVVAWATWASPYAQRWALTLNLKGRM